MAYSVSSHPSGHAEQILGEEVVRGAGGEGEVTRAGAPPTGGTPQGGRGEGKHDHNHEH